MLKPGASCEAPHCSLVSILVNTKKPQEKHSHGFLSWTLE